MYFTENALRKLDEEYQTIQEKCDHLLLKYVYRDYLDPVAKEHAVHGFSRRLKIITRCIHNTFKLLPPEQDNLPNDDNIGDATINVQAFVFNVFGISENLASIWANERRLRKKNGARLPVSWIGLRKENRHLRESLSPEFQQYLCGLDDWFSQNENFRHALAHRVPLYIPPHVVPEQNLALYRDLENQMAEAAAKLDFEERDRLEARQMDLAAFQPLMTHSFDENAAKVVFHAQLLADFNTINEIGQRMLKELDSLRG